MNNKLNKVGCSPGGRWISTLLKATQNLKIKQQLLLKWGICLWTCTETAAFCGLLLTCFLFVEVLCLLSKSSCFGILTCIPKFRMRNILASSSLINSPPVSPDFTLMYSLEIHILNHILLATCPLNFSSINYRLDFHRLTMFQDVIWRQFS